MFCNNCGSQLPDGSKFCNVCGSVIGGAQWIQYGTQQNVQPNMQQNVQGQQYAAQGQPYPRNAQMNGQQPYPQQKAMGGVQPNMQGQQYAPQGQPYLRNAQMNGQQPYPQQRAMNGAKSNMQKQGKQGGSKTKLIIGIIIGVVLIAGGILTWILLSKDKDDNKDNRADNYAGNKPDNYEVDEYLEKSAKGDDITTASTLATAVWTALANEDCYDEVMNAVGKSTGDVVILSVEPTGIGMDLSEDRISAVGAKLKNEVYLNIGKKSYLKYTEKGAGYYVVTCNQDGKVKVYISKSPDSLDWQAYPDVDPEYK